MSPPLLAIAVGNLSRGDDALAPMLLRRLEPWVVSMGLQEKVELLEDFQLQVEHAADMRGRERVLFLDAGVHTSPPFLFQRVQPSPGRMLLSHALPPEDLLAAYHNVYREPPPPSFVLCISGTQFSLGAPLSPEAAHHLEAAEAFARILFQADDLATWEKSAAIAHA